MIKINEGWPIKGHNQKRQAGLQFVGPCASCPLHGRCVLDCLAPESTGNYAAHRSPPKGTTNSWRKADGEILDCIRQAHDNGYN